jgi:hypothetical protein
LTRSYHKALHYSSHHSDVDIDQRLLVLLVLLALLHMETELLTAKRMDRKQNGNRTNKRIMSRVKVKPAWSWSHGCRGTGLDKQPMEERATGLLYLQMQSVNLLLILMAKTRTLHRSGRCQGMTMRARVCLLALLRLMDLSLASTVLISLRTFHPSEEMVRSVRAAALMCI